LAAALMIGTGYAQQAPATPAKQEKPAPSAPKPPVPEGLASNIRIEITITDQAGPGEEAKRTVSMIVADRKNGSIRSAGRVVTPSQSTPVFLNVDATPAILKDGLMRIDLGLEYVPKAGTDNVAPPNNGDRGSLNQRLSLLVQSGKAMIVSQASDPMSNRRIAVELTATILK
jgi:hypothetical protein